ncbi:MAG: aldo/keto reductase [Gammaproteobacteria bacterium]|nr:aldo/keto reductase [Gammaproteobacteria bacterium]
MGKGILTSFSSTDLRQLGGTDIHVSPLGLGTVKFGRNTDVKYPQPYNIPDKTHLDSLVSFAGELGINLLDTAPAYGDSEAKLGQLLRGRRHDWIISTKVGERYVDGKSSFDFSAHSIRQSIESSLLRLGTDYLDIILIHSNGKDEQILQQSDVVSELVLLRDMGTIRCIGASTKTIEGGLLALEMLDLVMIAYNPDDTSQAELLQEAERRNKGVIIKKALASGHAANVQKNIEFVLRSKIVSSAIVGTINPNHLRQNVGYAVSAIQ